MEVNKGEGYNYIYQRLWNRISQPDLAFSPFASVNYHGYFHQSCKSRQ